MKRQPKSKQAQDTKAAILEAATHIILREGLEKVSTNTIAEKAGVSIGSLYQYYDDKDEILQELLENLVGTRVKRIQDAISLSMLFESVDEITKTVVDSLFNTASEREARLEAHLLPLFMTAKNVKWGTEHIKKADEMMRPLLKALLMMKEPGLKKRNLDVVIFVIMQAIRGTIIGVQMNRAAKMDQDDLKKEMHLLIRSYLKGTVSA